MPFDTGHHLLHLELQAGGGGAQFRLRGHQARVFGTIAPRQFLDLGLCLGPFSLELLDQWVTQDRRDAGESAQITVAQGLRLTVLALRFSAVATGVDHAIAGHFQFVGADGCDPANVDQTLLFPIALKLLLGRPQVIAQLHQACVHPGCRGLRGFLAGVELAVGKALCQCVGRRCRQNRVRQLDLDFQQLALADELHAGVQHQVLGDDVEDVFFSWRFLHRHQPTQFRNPLIEVKVGQPLARREPGFRLLARVGDRVGGQVECFHRAFGEVS
ncbi:hypothetical protein D3C84_540520 [compost metagenome]